MFPRDLREQHAFLCCISVLNSMHFSAKLFICFKVLSWSTGLECCKAFPSLCSKLCSELVWSVLTTRRMVCKEIPNTMSFTTQRVRVWKTNMVRRRESNQPRSRAPRFAELGPAGGRLGGTRDKLPRGGSASARSKLNWKLKKTYFENKSNTILKNKVLAAKIKWFSRKI